MAVQQGTLAAPKIKTEGRRLHLMPLLSVAAVLVIVLGLARVVQTSQATTASFAMQSLQQEKLELETNVKQLEAEVATLSSLERIEREATRLGPTADALIEPFGRPRVPQVSQGRSTAALSTAVRDQTDHVVLHRNGGFADHQGADGAVRIAGP